MPTVTKFKYSRGTNYLIDYPELVHLIPDIFIKAGQVQHAWRLKGLFKYLARFIYKKQGRIKITIKLKKPITDPSYVGNMRINTDTFVGITGRFFNVYFYKLPRLGDKTITFYLSLSIDTDDPILANNVNYTEAGLRHLQNFGNTIAG